MQRITENVTLHRVERVLVRGSRLEFRVENGKSYLWDGEESAEWSIEGAVVESSGEDQEGVVAVPVDDYFVCEANANRAVDNVGPVRCRSVEA